MITSPCPDRLSGRKFVVTADSTVEPVTVNELKFWARIDGDDEDDVLAGIIKTARKNVEDFIRQSLIEKTIEMSLDSWDHSIYELPLSPVISITSVTTLDESDTATIYASSNYYLAAGVPARLVIKQDSENPLNTDRGIGGYKITYKAGYGETADEVPQAIKDAIKVWATYVYENRDPNPEPPKVVENLLRNFMIVRV